MKRGGPFNGRLWVLQRGCFPEQHSGDTWADNCSTGALGMVSIGRYHRLPWNTFALLLLFIMLPSKVCTCQRPFFVCLKVLVVTAAMIWI